MKILFYNSLRLLLCLALLSNNFVIFSQSPLNSFENPSDLENEARALGLKWNRQSIEKAIELYNKASEKWLEQNDSQKSVESSLEAGRLHQILGEKNEFERTLDDALESVKDKQLSNVESRIYSELSLLALENGQTEKCREFFEKALALSEQSGDVSAQAAAFFSAGEFYYFRNDIKNSLDAYKKSIDLWSEAGNLQGESKSLTSLAYLYLKQSDFDLGLDVLNRALSKYRQAGDVRGEALTLKAIGSVRNVMNEKQKALEDLHRAENLFPEDVDFAEKAMLFNSIGHLYEDYEEWSISLNYREKAFDLYKKENHLYGQLATLPSLGKLSALNGDALSATKYFEQGEALAKQLKDDFYLAIIKNQTGDFYFLYGDYQKAEQNYEDSLKLFKESIHQKYISQTLNNLGQIFEKQNQTAKARKNFESSLALSRKVRDKFGEADTLYHLAKLDFAEGLDDDALKLVKDSIEITENLYTEVLNSKLKSTYFSNVYDRYDLYINILTKLHRRFPQNGYDVQALQASENSRSRSMRETLRLTEADFTKDADPEMVRRENEIRNLLNVKADSLTDLLSRNSDQTEIQKVSADISELSNKLEEIKANFKQNSPVYSAIKNPPPFDIKEFQNQILDSDTMLLEFSFGETESYLWVIEKNAFSSFILPPREQIEASIENSRKLLDSRDALENESVSEYQKRLAENDKLYEQQSHVLSDELFGQIADRLGEKRLLIVPDGKLNYFPVSALPLPNSKSDDPILLSNEVIIEPSAATLLILAKSEKQSSQAEKSLLVFSDPIFSADDSRLSSNRAGEQKTDATALNNFRFAESLNSLPRLAASKDEAESIVNIVGSANSDVFSGFEANRERFLNSDVSNYKIIHLATHGLIDENRPELSGLMFSRFDEKGEKLNEFIRLQDIYAMNLNADLVVLSACSTGVGKRVRGEALMSLNNAFLQVGAKSVLSSLWKVEDNATVELMKSFYEIMAKENVAPPKALQMAKIKMYKGERYKSPFYWAAFTITGDFKRAPNLSISRSGDGYYALLFLVPILILGILFWLKKRNRKN